MPSTNAIIDAIRSLIGAKRGIRNPLSDDWRPSEKMIMMHKSHMKYMTGNLDGRKTRSIVNGEDVRKAIPYGTGMAFPRNVKMEKDIHELLKVAHNLPREAYKEYKRIYSGTTAIVPAGFYHKHDPKKLQSAFQATYNPLRNAGVGRTDSFASAMNYSAIGDVMPEWAMNLPVTKDIGDSYVREREQEEENRRRNLRRDRYLAKQRFAGSKEFPLFRSFFRDSKKSVRDVNGIYKILKGISKVPVLGHIAKMSPAGLATSAVSAILASLNSYYREKTNSNSVATKWQNIPGVWGNPSKEFTDAALDAGLEKDQIDKAWAKFQEMGGVEAYRPLGGIEAGLGKGLVMKSLGFNENDMRILDKMQGAKSDKFREQNAAISKLKAVRDLGYAEGTQLSTKLEANRYQSWLGSSLMQEDAERMVEVQHSANDFAEKLKDPKFRKMAKYHSELWPKNVPHKILEGIWNGKPVPNIWSGSSAYSDVDAIIHKKISNDVQSSATHDDEIRHAYSDVDAIIHKKISDDVQSSAIHDDEIRQRINNYESESSSSTDSHNIQFNQTNNFNVGEGQMSDSMKRATESGIEKSREAVIKSSQPLHF